MNARRNWPKPGVLLADLVTALRHTARVVWREGISGLARVVRCVLARRHDYALSVPFGYEIAAPRPAPPLAVVCHLFHHDLAPVLAGYFRNIPFPSSSRPIRRPSRTTSSDASPAGSRVRSRCAWRPIAAATSRPSW
jgi:hypothetical protein